MIDVLEEQTALLEQGISSSQPSCRVCQDLGKGSCSWCDRSAVRQKQHAQPKMYTYSRVRICQLPEIGKLGHTHTAWTVLHPYKTCKLFTQIPVPCSSNKAISYLFCSPKRFKRHLNTQQIYVLGPSSKLEVERRNRGILSRLTSDQEVAKGLLSFACTLPLCFVDSVINTAALDAQLKM